MGDWKNQGLNTDPRTEGLRDELPHSRKSHVATHEMDVYSVVASTADPGSSLPDSTLHLRLRLFPSPSAFSDRLGSAFIALAWGSA